MIILTNSATSSTNPPMLFAILLDAPPSTAPGFLRNLESVTPEEQSTPLATCIDVTRTLLLTLCYVMSRLGEAIQACRFFWAIHPNILASMVAALMQSLSTHSTMRSVNGEPWIPSSVIVHKQKLAIASKVSSRPMPSRIGSLSRTSNIRTTARECIKRLRNSLTGL